MNLARVLFINLILFSFFYLELEAQVDLSGSTIAHFDFNGSPEDKSSNGNHGNVLGAKLVEDRFGNCEYAYGFENSPNVISIPNQVMDGLESFSVSIWIKTNNQGVAITAANNQRHNEFFIQIRPEGHVYTTVRADPSKVRQGVAGTTKIIDGAWHHILVTRDHLSGEMAIYIDGNPDVKTNVLLAGNEVPKLALDVAANGLHLGADQDCIGGCWDATQQFIGVLDDIWFFDKVLSQEEIQYLMDIDELKVVPQITLESNISTCDETRVLDAGEGFDSYQWNTGEITQTITVNTSGTYHVLTTFDNCEYTAQVNVTLLNSTLSITANDEVISCNRSIFIMASPGFDNYTWSNGLIGSSIEVDSPGEYSVTVSGPCGELTSDHIVIRIKEEQELEIQASQPSLNCSLDIVVMTASEGFKGYSWSNGMKGKIAEVKAPGNYTVTAFDDCSNELSTSIDIVVEVIDDVFIPNTFTPNGDGKNDVFEIDIRLVGARMLVVNRWGNKVYESFDYQNSWNGDDLMDGSYFFLVKHPCLGQDYKGWVKIIR
jgi:gliding motility-associated-like protein